jgi:3-hydroxyacyl-CoA dehydrogenase
MTKLDDGSRLKEVFDLTAGNWRTAATVALDAAHSNLATLLYADDAAGRFAWDVTGGTLCYAANLVPEISDDIVSIDRAMRWGYAWKAGPFEMLDTLGSARVVARLEANGEPVPKMLGVLRDAGAQSFYREDGSEFLGLDGAFHRVLAPVDVE